MNRCRLKVFLLDIVNYKTAWRYQRAISEHLNDCRKRGAKDYAGYMIVLQHESVYTIGKGGDVKNLLSTDHQHDIYRVERGGDITWHGPGQLTIYPILNLDYFKRDLHWYLRNLEETVLNALASGFNITGSRSAVNTGVWLGNNKISAIGVTASRWISMHGCSINVHCDLDSFKSIVPCGIADSSYGVTNLSNELQTLQNNSVIDRNQTTNSSVISSIMQDEFDNTLDDSLLLNKMADEYLCSFSKIFDVDIILGEESELQQLVMDYPVISTSDLISL